MNSKNLSRIFLMLALMTMIIFSGSIVSGQVDEAPTRDQIEDKYKWNLNDLFATDADWEQTYKDAGEATAMFDKYKGQLGSSADLMAECLLLDDSLSSWVHRLWVYAGLSNDQDQSVAKYQEYSQQMSSLRSKMSQATSFIRPEILAIDNDKLMSFLDESKKLQQYRFFIEDMIRQKAHILSPKEEEILASTANVTDAARQIFDMMDNVDIKFGTIKDADGNEVELTRQRYSKMLESQDRDLRKRASDKYESSFLPYQNTLGATLAASVTNDYFYAKTRGYETCLDMVLDGNDIPREVFFNLIKTVDEGLAPHHKYISLRKKKLGVDTLYKYDMYIPLIPVPTMEYTYDEAVETVLAALAPLGEKYVKEAKHIFDSRWIDVYETKDKYGGGYNWGTYSVHPYILMNYSGSINNVFTLAHEIGHAMHAIYTNKNEPYTYAGHSRTCAEMASTCNEALLMDYLLKKTTNDDEKLYLLNYSLQGIEGTFFTQTMFSEFEVKAHETIESGGALSAESMKAMYREIYEKYQGPDFFLEENKDIGCLRISHFYRQYYVYSYAVSFSASQMLATRILNGEKGAIEDFYEFLSTGTSLHPVDIIKKAGIDITTTAPYENVIKIYSDLVDQYEQLLDK